MRRFLLACLAVLAGVAPASPSHAQTAGAAETLAVLGQQVETIADQAAAVCSGDVAAKLLRSGQQLSNLKKLSHGLDEIKRLYGRQPDFPATEARRIAARIAVLDDALVRLTASAGLVREAGAPLDAAWPVFEEAVQSLCPHDPAASVTDDACTIAGGTPGEVCGDCFFGLLTCCEKICTKN